MTLSTGPLLYLIAGQAWSSVICSIASFIDKLSYYNKFTVKGTVASRVFFRIVA